MNQLRNVQSSVAKTPRSPQTTISNQKEANNKIRDISLDQIKQSLIVRTNL